MSILSFAKKMAGREERKNPKKSATTVADKPAATPEAKNAVPAALSGRVGLMPMITENSIMMHGTRQTVLFRVRPDASKQAIAAAVTERFGVEPASIRTLHVWGKARRRGRTVGSTPAWKKAYVTLPAGKTIDIAA